MRDNLETLYGAIAVRTPKHARKELEAYLSFGIDEELLWAEWLQNEVLAAVPHRHVVLTMPRLLRGIFRKRRGLLLDLWQCAAEAVLFENKKAIEDLAC